MSAARSLALISPLWIAAALAFATSALAACDRCNSGDRSDAAPSTSAEPPDFGKIPIPSDDILKAINDPQQDIVLATVAATSPHRRDADAGAWRSARWGTATFQIDEVWRSQRLAIGNQIEVPFYCTSGGDNAPGGWTPCPTRGLRVLLAVKWQAGSQRPELVVMTRVVEALLPSYRGCLELRAGSGDVATQRARIAQALASPRERLRGCAAEAAKRLPPEAAGDADSGPRE